MAMEPKSFQLKAAAQGLYCLEGPFKLFLLGDEMGVGKTLSAILMMWKMREQPGMSIVFCPKSLCQLWVDSIHRAWEEV
jgi:SNF2 family DNA or RNA helicase